MKIKTEESHSNALLLTSERCKLNKILSEEIKNRLFDINDIIDAIEFGAGGMYGYSLDEDGEDVNQIKRFLTEKIVDKKTIRQ